MISHQNSPTSHHGLGHHAEFEFEARNIPSNAFAVQPIKDSTTEVLHLLGNIDHDTGGTESKSTKPKLLLSWVARLCL